MSSRALRIAVALAALLAIGVPAAVAADTPALVEAGNVSFPDRQFVLTIPKAARLDPSSVRIFENNVLIPNFTLVSAQEAAKGRFGVILAVDGSLSMSGKPIAAAMAAARAFAAKRAPNEAIGLITFNNRVDVPLALTADATAIDRALSRQPALKYGTKIFDALGVATSLLKQAKVSAGSVVLISDGRDTGSALSAAKLASQATAARVRIFTVGLHSPQFRPGTLQKIAAGSGASYSDASSPTALTPIYRALSSQLSNEYLLRYQSPASPDTVVRVQVNVSGYPNTAVSFYRTPALPTKALPPYHRSAFQRFWVSAGAMVIVSLAAGLLAALALIGLTRGRRWALRRRVADFVAIATQQAKEQRQRNWNLETVDRALGRTRWWAQFKEEVEIAQFPMEPAQIVVAAAACSIVLAWLAGLLLPAIVILLVLPIPPVVALALVKRKLYSRRELFADQLPDNLNVLASALRAGHSFSGALSVMIDETDEPSHSEFRRAIADEQLGVPVEDSLLRIAARMDSTDLEQVALVASLQRQTGGNLAEVLDTVVETIRERAELRRLVKTLTAQGRMSRWILTALPVALLLFISVSNPHYESPLFHTTVGQFLLILGAVMVVAASLAIDRIVKIKI